METSALDGKFNFFKMVLGVTRRLVEQFPEDKMNFQPSPGARTPAEIVSHMYTFLYDAAKSAKDGKFVESNEPKLTTKTEVLNYMDSQIDKAYEIYQTITEEEFDQEFSAWGDKFTGRQFVSFVFDEHWHHRGQLTVYLRMTGVTPMLVYDYQ